MRIAIVTLVILGAAATAAAQGGDSQTAGAKKGPGAIPRVFVLATAQQFAAADTFDTTFGRAVHPFFGGGVQVLFPSGLFVDGTISFFRKTGHRGFTFQGEDFDLGVPLKASLTPIELTAGYRWALGPRSRLTPYLGGGIGSYSYSESTDFDESDEEVSLRKAGYLVLAGAEYRMTRRLGLAVDGQYSRVPGILGDGGLSGEFDEDNLGGMAVRFRLMVGN